MVVSATELRELKLRARARLALDKRKSETDLRTFQRIYQPKYREPTHLSRLVDALDESLHRRMLIVCEAPPRHYKTSTIMAHMARLLRHRAGASVAYCTYANDIAKRRSRNVRELAARAGVWVGEEQTTQQRFDPSKSVSFWQTEHGGQFVAGGRRGQFVGEGFSFICADDLIKDLAESESELVQEEAWQAFKMLFARLEPGGTMLLTNQRWGENDPIGKLKAWVESDPDAPAVVVITVQAIVDIEIETDEQGHERIVGGTPVCDRFTLDELRERASALGPMFWPQYQQDTTPRGKRVFPELVRYQRPHFEHAFGLISCDPGISKRDANKGRAKQPDPAGVVACLAYLGTDKLGKPRVGLDLLFAAELWLEGVDLLDFLEGLQNRVFPGFPVLLEEVGAFKLLESVGARINPNLQITAITPHGSKFWRAQPSARAAEHSLIRVPQTLEVARLAAPGLAELAADEFRTDWIAPFCKEVRHFTGREGRRDGRVDALTQAYDQAEIAFGLKGAGASSGGSGSLTQSPY